MKERARVLMLGTSLEGRGGIATAVSVLRQSGLFERERVRYVCTHADGSRAVKARHALSAFWQAAHICLVQRPAIVHVHAATGASFARKSLLLLIARLAGCQTIFHFHSGHFREFATRRSGPLMRRWIRHTLERSALVLTLSEGWSGFVRDIAPRAQVAVLPNSVQLPPGAPALRTEPGRILFLGRVEEAKGVCELLQACALLAPRYPALRVVLAGNGDLDGAQRQARALGMAGRVELPGWLGSEARGVELERAEVFCLPSHAEGMSMAVLEAMAAGKAVVATRVGAIPEVIVDGENGLLAPPRDGAALAGVLARALDDAALRERLGLRARETVERHYSVDAVGARLGAIYRQLER